MSSAPPRGPTKLPTPEHPQRFVMPEDERRRSKGHVRYTSRHGIGSKANSKSKSHINRNSSSNELLNEEHLAKSVTRLKLLHSRKQPQKKAVIQLDRSDSDENEEYSDVDSDADQKPADLDEDQPQLRTTRTLAPQLTNETVVSVSDIGTAAARNNDNSRRFIEESDFLSRAVGDTRNDDELRSIVGQNSMRTQGLLSRQRQQQRRGRSEVAPAPREAKKESRQMEKVFKQYFNCRAVQNPVLQSLSRVGPQLEQRNDVSPFAKRNKNLTATTLTQIDGSSSRENEVLFILNKMWTEGYQDPDKTPADTPAGSRQQSPRGTPAGSRRGSPRMRPMDVR